MSTEVTSSTTSPTCRLLFSELSGTLAKMSTTLPSTPCHWDGWNAFKDKASTLRVAMLWWIQMTLVWNCTQALKKKKLTLRTEDPPKWNPVSAHRWRLLDLSLWITSLNTSAKCTCSSLITFVAQVMDLFNKKVCKHMSPFLVSEIAAQTLSFGLPSYIHVICDSLLYRCNVLKKFAMCLDFVSQNVSWRRQNSRWLLMEFQRRKWLSMNCVGAAANPFP